MKDTTKFFGFELGAQCMCDAKNDKYVVNGKHDAVALSKLLDVFIEKFLLCSVCKNPETSIEVQKNGNIQLRCMACGETTAVDSRHRLATFIIKNPPSATRYQKAGVAVSERQANKAGSAEGGIEGVNSSDASSSNANAEEGGGVTVMSDVNLDAVADAANSSRAKKAKNGGNGSKNNEDDDFGDDWGSADFSKDAMDARRAALLGGKAKETGQSEVDPIDALSAFLCQSPTPSPSAIRSHVQQSARENSWSESNTLAAIYGALFGHNIMANIKKRSPILKLFIFTPSDQKQVLFLTERLASKDNSASLKIADILNAFYDADILEEDIIVKWHKNPSKKIDRDLSRALRERSQVFVDWLLSADDEDDEDDEDDQDEE